MLEVSGWIFLHEKQLFQQWQLQVLKMEEGSLGKGEKSFEIANYYLSSIINEWKELKEV